MLEHFSLVPPAVIINFRNDAARFRCHFLYFVRVFLLKLRYFGRMGLLKLRFRFFEGRMFLLKLGMAACQLRKVCLKSGYFPRDETDLRSNRVLWRVCINHPIQVIDIFLECFHTGHSVRRIELRKANHTLVYKLHTNAGPTPLDFI